MKKNLGGRRLLAMVCLSWICCTLHLSVNGQKTSPSEKKIRLEDLLNKIESRDHVSFFITGARTLLDRLVPASLEKVPVQELRNKYLPLYGLTCTLSSYRKDVYELEATLIHVMGTVYEGGAGNRTLLKGVNVEIKGTKIIKETRDNGNFSIDSVPADAVLRFTAVDLVAREFNAIDCQGIGVPMERRIDAYDSATVFSNGYITKMKNSTTWSADAIPKARLEQSLSSNILERIEHRSTSLLYTHPSRDNTYAENIIIRGPSTINGGTQPTIVVNDQPYYGDASNINPEDVESVTVLKDATALSIYGVRAGNAVIVFNMKKNDSARRKLTFITGFNIQGRPYIPNFSVLTSGDLIDFQIKAYQSGYYNASLGNGVNISAVPPAVELADAEFRGRLSHDDVTSQLAAMRRVNLQNDIDRYFYQTSVEQQYTLQFAGNTSHFKYFVSGGVNQYYGNQVGVSRQRRTFRANVSYNISKKWALEGNLNYASASRVNGFNSGYNPSSYFTGKSIPTYFPLFDAHGNAQPFYGDLSHDYMRQQAALGYRNAVWSPGDAIGQELNKLETHDLLTNVNLTHTFSDRWKLDIKYQNEWQRHDGNDLFKGDSYVVNTIWNNYAQVDPTGRLFSNIPFGGIAYTRRQRINANQLRVQVDYRFLKNGLHDLLVYAGGEYRNISSKGDSTLLYGVGSPYGPPVINNEIYFPAGMTGIGEPQTIPTSMGNRNTRDNFLSGFISGTYTYLDRYTFSATFREDIANLFGTETNRNIQPLWSTGVTWHLEREDFFSVDFLSKLSFQASVGVLGNISRLGYPYTTIDINHGGITGTPYTTAFTLNAPNKDFRWEKVKIYNWEANFVTKDTRLYGTIGFFSKTSYDLMASIQVDPTRGSIQNPLTPASAYMNIARMRTNGVDIGLTMHNLKGKVKWVTNYFISAAASKIIDYPGPTGAGNQYLDVNTPNPVKGRSPYGVYAYKWLYLDGKGNPVGRYNGQADTLYDAIYNNTSLDSMIYKGSAQPKVFGSVMNTISKGPWSLFWTISFKLKYFMRRPVVSYSTLLQSWNSHGSYKDRWQAAGDERSTDIPSSSFTGNTYRDLFTANSDKYVIRADNVRLEEIGVGYQVNSFKWVGINVQQARLFINLSNIGPLWIANKQHIDANYNNIPRESMRFSVGGSFSF